MEALRAKAIEGSDHALGIVLITVMLGIGGAGPALLFVALDSEPVDKWSPLSSMIIPRAWPEVVTLPDGDVLVTGGLSVNGPTAYTEVFDPDTGTWTPGPTMSVARLGHTATLLADGTVLVTGGETGRGVTAKAEILDMANDATLTLPDMYFARAGHAAVALADGKVLVSGGTDWVSGLRSEAEAYDPVSHSWLPAGTMSTKRIFFDMHLLADGSAIAVGGDNGATSELYHPGSNSWSDAADMASVRYNSASVTTATGEVLVAGGLVDGVPIASSEMYDPDTNSWFSAGEMLSARAHFTLTVLDDGRVLAAGSWSSEGETGSAELFCQCNMRWSAAAAMVKARGTHGAALLGNGTVLIMGGRTTTGVIASVELYTSVSESPGPPPPPPPPPYCQPIDLLPLVAYVAPEMPGHSAHGLVAKILVAQSYYDRGDIESCLEILDAFYNQVRAFLGSGHMSPEGASMLYDGYESVVECLGGTPQPEIP